MASIHSKLFDYRSRVTGAVFTSPAMSDTHLFEQAGMLSTGVVE